MIVSDARAFQSTLKMQTFDHPSSNFNLWVGPEAYHLGDMLLVGHILARATCLELY